MKDVSLADRDYKLWVRLHQARHAVYSARDRELRQFGVTTMEAAVLFVVQALGKAATPAEISRWLFREPHTVVGILNRMEKKGLVRRVKDLEKKNWVRVMMTEKGQQAYDQSMKTEELHRIMSSLSEEERQQLSSCLEKVIAKALMELGINRKLPFP